MVGSRRIVQPFLDDRVRHRVQQRNVRARPKLQMQSRVIGQFDPARIDDDQFRPAADRLHDAIADDRMVLRRIGAAHQNRAGQFDVVERIGGGAGSQHELHPGRRRRMADPRAAVDVVGADHDSGEFLGDVVLFVGRPGRPEHADGVRAELVDDHCSRSATN